MAVFFAARGSRAKTRRFRLWASMGSLFLLIAAAELAARIIVRWRVSPERIHELTNRTMERGRFASHPNLPYVMRPRYESHNSLGFRGSELRAQDSQRVPRVFCLGASTTYGEFVNSENAYPALIEQQLRNQGLETEVINAGVPGWVSTEILINFQLRIVPLKPDVVVFYEGRNEVFPQLYNNFRSDYSHFRRSDHSIAHANYYHRPVFRLSHLVLGLAVYTRSLGYSEREDHPAYGSIRTENEPTAEHLVLNSQDIQRDETYRDSLCALIAIAKQKGISVVLCTMAFRPEKLATGLLHHKSESTLTILANRVEANNKILRQVANQYQTELVETAQLAKFPDLFIDDCHMGNKGHNRRAELISPIVKSVLLQRKQQ